MLRYYSYYSVGGYKDFILGTNQSGVEATYYLPLLPALEERAKDDAEVSKTLQSLKRLPRIKHQRLIISPFQQELCSLMLAIN